MNLQSGPYRLPLPVAVVVPVRDEESSLQRLLDSLEAQTSPPSEIIVVDGGSSDRTLEIALQHAQRSQRLRVVVPDGTATPGRGRNVGVAAAASEWLAFTDAGIRVERDWLERLWAAHLAAPQSEVVYGNYEFETRSFFEECAAMAYCLPKRATPVGPCRGPSVVSLLLRRQVYQAVGGFPDLRAGEDEIFLRALDASDAQIAWAPDATVWWQLRPDLGSTLARFRLYSYYNVLAGQQEHWHYPMVRSYLPVAVGLALSAGQSYRWLALSAGVLATRAVTRISRHCKGSDCRRQLQPARLALVTSIMLLTDLATVVGWCQATSERHFARGGQLPSAGTGTAGVAASPRRTTAP